MGRWCDVCEARFEPGAPVVTARRRSVDRRSRVVVRTTGSPLLHFHRMCWERVSVFGGYARCEESTAIGTGIGTSRAG